MKNHSAPAISGNQPLQPIKTKESFGAENFSSLFACSINYLLFIIVETKFLIIISFRWFGKSRKRIVSVCRLPAYVLRITASSGQTFELLYVHFFLRYFLRNRNLCKSKKRWEMKYPFVLWSLEFFDHRNHGLYGRG